ncbi:hypothetical protein MPNTM1_04896 [Mycolicibacterium parafortuitum]
MSSGAIRVNNWNHRALQSLDGREYCIAEVFYDGDALIWVDGSRTCLRRDNDDDLEATVQLIGEAFDKHLRRVQERDLLVEV